MNMHRLRHRFGLKSVALLVLASFNSGQEHRLAAGVVTWQSAKPISGDSDVDTTGTLVYAYNFGATSDPPFLGPVTPVQSVTVQGVTFAPLAAPPFAYENVNTVTVGDVTVSEFPGVLNGIDTNAASGSFASLSASYQGLVGTAITANVYAEISLTLNGLQSGRNYRFQTWVNDSRNDSAIFNRVEANGEGSTIAIKANLSESIGGLGQYAIGTFTATGSTQVIHFNGIPDVDGIITYSRNPLVNGFQLRLEPSGQVPEPASMVIFGLGSLAGWIRFGRQSSRNGSLERG
jgi:hypothetical protein